MGNQLEPSIIVSHPNAGLRLNTQFGGISKFAGERWKYFSQKIIFYPLGIMFTHIAGELPLNLRYHSMIGRCISDPVATSISFIANE